TTSARRWACLRSGSATRNTRRSASCANTSPKWSEPRALPRRHAAVIMNYIMLRPRGGSQMHPLVRLLSPLAVVLLLLAGVALAADEKDKATALVEKLGDDDVDVRKDATKKLLEMGEDAVPALLKAIKSHPDADVKLRAIILRQDIFKKLY